MAKLFYNMIFVLTEIVLDKKNNPLRRSYRHRAAVELNKIRIARAEITRSQRELEKTIKCPFAETAEILNNGIEKAAITHE